MLLSHRKGCWPCHHNLFKPSEGFQILFWSAQALLLSKSWQQCIWAKACSPFPSVLLSPNAQLASLPSHPGTGLAPAEEPSPAVLEAVILPQIITEETPLGPSVSVWAGLQPRFCLYLGMRCSDGVWQSQQPVLVCVL